MPSRIQDCLNLRVEAGLISKASAKRMVETAEQIEFDYCRQGMGPDQAAAAAVTETARIFKEAAERKRFQTAQQIIAIARVMAEVQAHPRGVSAGAMSLLTRDVWEAGTSSANVEVLSEIIEGQLQRRFATGLDAYKSTRGGLVQDKIGVRNLVRELFGVKTGDTTASRAAKEWANTADAAVKRFNAAGGNIAAREDWRLPQVHDADRLREAGFERWRDTITPLLDEATWNRIETLRRDEPDALPAGKSREEILRTIYDNIITDLPPPPGAKGASVGRHNARRFFVFKDADSWLTYNDQFGSGEGGIYDLLTNHIGSMARDIALVEVLGPKPNSTVRALIDMAERERAGKTGLSRGSPLNVVEGPKAIQRTFDVVSGRINGGNMGYAASFLNGLRNWLSAAKLGSAIISAVPSDLVTTAWAARWNGSSIGGLLKKALSEMNEQQALRLGIMSESMKDGGLSSKRYADTIMGDGFSRRVASTVIRAQGLAAWTQRMKNAFTMEMLGFIADNVKRGFGDLDKPLRDMLTRYGITEAEWDVIRAAPLTDVGGARFFDPENVPDRRLGEKLMQAIIQERKFAILEPDARVRQITTAGLASNTFMGQVARSATHLKSFALTMMTTHMWRAAIQADPARRLGYFAGIASLLTMAGALSLQAKALLAGKDPRPMDDPNFWGAAMLQGGALGFFGDFLSTATGRGGGTVITGLLGPTVGFGNDVGRLASSNLRKLYEGEPSTFGAEAARFIRSNTPGANLWYARLALDRALWDQVQTVTDPEWRKSFRRMERRAREEFDQGFWWRPGETLPSRAPDFSQ